MPCNNTAQCSSQTWAESRELRQSSTSTLWPNHASTSPDQYRTPFTRRWSRSLKGWKKHCHHTALGLGSSHCTNSKDQRLVRICGDYNLTANIASKTESYLLPRIENLFASLAGGEVFSKLDLSHAYLQLLVAEEFQPLLIVNTHKGLYQYLRLPFGVSSAPAIFQRTMEI